MTATLISDAIQWIPHHRLDKTRWDQCISGSDNGNVYTYSFYLDRTAPGWDALVMGDYQAVMPLPYRKKLGIRYIWQPFLTAQLGVFGKDLNEPLIYQFIKAIPRIFRLIEYPMNDGNRLAGQGKQVIHRNNFILPLSPGYGSLQKNYHENTRRNIRRAAEAGCTGVSSPDIEEIISLASRQMKTADPEALTNLHIFRDLFATLSEKKMATAWGIQQNGRLLASCVFFQAHNRCCYILAGNHPEAKQTGASHALIDYFIRENAEKPFLLDFEGSDIPGLARFYQGFGALNQPYPALRINRLPWLLRWLKPAY